MHRLIKTPPNYAYFKAFIICGTIFLAPLIFHIRSLTVAGWVFAWLVLLWIVLAGFTVRSYQLDFENAELRVYYMFGLFDRKRSVAKLISYQIDNHSMPHLGHIGLLLSLASKFSAVNLEDYQVATFVNNKGNTIVLQERYFGSHESYRSLVKQLKKKIRRRK